LRLRGVLSLACVAAIVDAAPARGVPPGYYVDPIQAAAPRPAQSDEATGEFTYSIRRGFADSTAARLLGIAEATYPARETLVRIASENAYEMGSDTARADLWWCKGPGESRIPYAVTAGALSHYLNLAQLYRERKFREAGTRPVFWSELAYRATIAHREQYTLERVEYRDVYVAQLMLAWTYDDGTFTPYTEGHRVVVLTPSGDVLAVDGDGSAVERVSISSHQGIGRHEQILR
jgi:hypothetical protein